MTLIKIQLEMKIQQGDDQFDKRISDAIKSLRENFQNFEIDLIVYSQSDSIDLFISVSESFVRLVFSIGDCCINRLTSEQINAIVQKKIVIVDLICQFMRFLSFGTELDTCREKIRKDLRFFIPDDTIDQILGSLEDFNLNQVRPAVSSEEYQKAILKPDLFDYFLFFLEQNFNKFGIRLIGQGELTKF
ncbi:MAG: hypothetical protein NZO16_05475 [Deltaproteobacteria bacterium]|nr:hypothetical protein [Deltaproteobacteria bacterium]